MTIAKSKIIITLLFALLLFIQAISLMPGHKVQAATSLWNNQVGIKDGEIGKAFGESTNPKDIRVMVAQIIKVFLSLLGIIFLVLLVWAGYKWMMSGGNEQTVADAKSQIGNALIGLVIVLMSYSITIYVTRCVFNATSDTTFWLCSGI